MSFIRKRNVRSKKIRNNSSENLFRESMGSHVRSGKAYIYSNSYAASQRWKAYILAIVLSFGMFLGWAKPAQATFGEDAAAIIGYLGAGFSTFLQNMQTTMFNALMQFLQQRLMGFLQGQLVNVLGQNFGNLVFRQLAATTTNSQSIRGVKTSVLGTIQDNRVKAETAARIERVLGQDAEHGTVSTGSGGEGDQRGAGGTAAPV
ncbi:MAG TPA: hypothetical protein VIY47_04735, partial [Ignavibacteriaceae bacterium]